jgi:hypothetical protein
MAPLNRLGHQGFGAEGAQVARSVRQFLVSVAAVAWVITGIATPRA